MKFNLKNRPKLLKEIGEIEGKTDEDNFNIGRCYGIVDRWFEGFEKELRFFLSNIEDSDAVSHKAQTVILKEILGETK